MPTSSRLAPFPPERPDRMRTPASLVACGIALRALCDDDQPWLRDLYASTREEEMAQVPWPETHRRAFLDQQFEAQHRHYLQVHADADFLAVCDERGPLGRLYLLRSPPDHLLVDISLFPAARGRGIGASLIGAAQQAAAVRGCGMTLHVLQHNTGARRLYERLGFAASEAAFPYLRMDWRARPVS